MDTTILEDLGLSHAEAKIYLALLEAGSSKIGPVITATKLQSSTVYHILGSLLQKGLVSYIFKGKVKYYQAENPEAFLFFLEEKKRKFESILPKLKEKGSSREKQTAGVYEGLKGLKTAFNNILISLNPGEEYYFFQVPEEKLVDKKVILFLRNYHLKRSAKDIRVKGLALWKNKKLVKKIFTGLKHTKIRYLHEFTPTGIIIYKNKVITLDWDRIPTAFVIQSDSVANSYKKFFEEKWKTAKL